MGRKPSGVWIYPDMRRANLFDSSNMYLSGHAPDKYTLTRGHFRRNAAKPRRSAEPELSKGIQRSDSLTDPFGPPPNLKIWWGKPQMILLYLQYGKYASRKRANKSPAGNSRRGQAIFHSVRRAYSACDLRRADLSRTSCETSPTRARMTHPAAWGTSSM